MTIAIRQSNEFCVGIEELFADLTFIPGKQVFVKPNLCGREPVSPGENTSVAVMDALLEVLQNRRCSVTIGHGELLGTADNRTPFAETLHASGFDRYLNRPGVSMVNLDELPRVAVETEEMTFHLPAPLLDGSFDTYINLAKIKTHMEATVSLSLKNQMGLPAAGDRALMHKTNLERCIARLATIIKPHISILEGCPAMEGNGPHHGTPRNLNLIAAGTDMLELDSCIAGLFGFNPAAIPHFSHAVELGVGCLADASIMARFAEFRVPDFLPASPVYGFGRTVRAWPTYACSRCIYAVERAGRKIKKQPLKYWRFVLRAYFGKPLNIVFGRADQAAEEFSGDTIYVGSCSKEFSQNNRNACLDKCPPTIEETLSFIIQGSKP